MSDPEITTYLLRRSPASSSSRSSRRSSWSTASAAIATALLLVLGVSLAAACDHEAVGNNDFGDHLYCADEGEECLSCEEWAARTIECCTELGDGFEWIEECAYAASDYEDLNELQSFVSDCNDDADTCDDDPGCSSDWENKLLCSGSCDDFLACLTNGH